MLVETAAFVRSLLVTLTHARCPSHLEVTRVVSGYLSKDRLFVFVDVRELDSALLAWTTERLLDDIAVLKEFEWSKVSLLDVGSGLFGPIDRCTNLRVFSVFAFIAVALLSIETIFEHDVIDG